MDGLALGQGADDTLATLREWRRDGWTIVERWIPWSLLAAVGLLAIGFVACATAFSLVTQAITLGGAASTIASELGLSPGVLILGLLPHALPELIVLFLPLAAWIAASRVGDWHKLLAATFVTVAIALPVLVLTAAVETWVTPRLLATLTG